MKKLSLLTNIKYMFNKKLKAKINELEKELVFKQQSIEILNAKKDELINKVADLAEEVYKRGITIKNLKARVKKLTINV